MLIRDGAAIDRRDNKKNTPLHVACECGHLNVVNMLLRTGFTNPNCVNARAETPLHAAAAHGHLHVVRRLMDPKPMNDRYETAKASLQDVDGNTAAQLAMTRHFHEVAAFLTGETTAFLDDSDDDGSVLSDAEVFGALLQRHFADTTVGDTRFSPPPASPLARGASSSKQRAGLSRTNSGGLSRTKSAGLSMAQQLLEKHNGAAAAEQIYDSEEGEPPEGVSLELPDSSTDQILRLAHGLGEKELGLVVSTLSRMHRELKDEKKRMNKGTRKREESRRYEQSLRAIPTIAALRTVAEDGGVVERSDIRLAQTKETLIQVMLEAYQDIVRRGGIPPAPVEELTPAARAQGPRAPTRSQKTLYRELDQHRALGKNQEDVEREEDTAAGRTNTDLQSLDTPADAVSRRSKSPAGERAGRSISREVSRKFTYTDLVGSWYVASAPEGAGIDQILLWHKKKDLFFDQDALPRELVSQMKTLIDRTIGHESLVECERVLTMVESTQLPAAFNPSYGKLSRYTEQKRVRAKHEAVDGGERVDIRGLLWDQAGRSGATAPFGSISTSLAVRRALQPEPEPEPEPLRYSRIGEPAAAVSVAPLVVSDDDTDEEPHYNPRSPGSGRGGSPVPAIVLDSQSKSNSKGNMRTTEEDSAAHAVDAANVALFKQEQRPALAPAPAPAPTPAPAPAPAAGGGGGQGMTRLERQMEAMRAEKEAARDAKRAARRLAKQQAPAAGGHA